MKKAAETVLSRHVAKIYVKLSHACLKMAGLFKTPERVLVFAAHPDDELIGAGGTICRLHREDCAVRVVLFSRGGGGLAASGRAPYEENMIEEVRTREAEKVAAYLGVEHRILEIPEVIDRRSVVRRLVAEVRDFKPDMVFTHSPNDKHHLHRAVSECSTEACWHSMTRAYGDLGEPWRVGTVYFFEVFDLFPNPGMIVDVTPTFNMKIKAMSLYRSQIRVFPNILKYLRALAQVRGYLIDRPYAEAFVQSPSVPRAV